MSLEAAVVPAEPPDPQAGDRGVEAVVIGAGPAGLMAAQMLAEAGVVVDVFDAMPSAGRKFLLAGKGGLNLTHSEPLSAFAGRYRSSSGPAFAGPHPAESDAAHPALRKRGLAGLADLSAGLPGLADFPPDAVRAWAAGLGVDTFVGSSGRVFPLEMKAAPLLRAWLHRLRRQGVRFHMRHRWQGFTVDGAWRMASPHGERLIRPRAVVLALGGASWSRLGSDGAWVPWLRDRGLGVQDLQPSNCGFDVGWSAHFRARFAGTPLKSVAIAWRRAAASQGFAMTARGAGATLATHGVGSDRTDGAALPWQRGECVVTDTGVEGSLIYAASADLRETLRREGRAVFHLDLLPAREAGWVLQALGRGRGTRSLSTHLKSRLGLDGVKAGLLHERLTREQMLDGPTLAAAIKALPIVVTSTRPIDESISSAGGVRLDELDDSLMLRRMPGVFCAGEMLDWEAPTGGYLLTGCLCTGRLAGLGAVRWLGLGACAAPSEASASSWSGAS